MIRNIETVLKDGLACQQTLMDDIHKRMTMTLIQIASVTEKLEKEGDADAHTRIGTAISRYVEVAKNTTVNLKSISRNGRK